ncbi:LLM class F420-dependent oxidoreductase [Jatrophihabitans telluris]|uniref:LLM class F420-dependent oxidoreductase n=1 Tax=Jatrophihabitans telluris TaxID=2038343 RepID=UPI003221C9C5
MTIPLPGTPLPAHAELVRALPGWGYTDVWSSEVSGADAFTPLALASVWQPQLTLGTAIVPVFTRGPALIAQSAATMAAAAPGRFVLGLGASSPAIVEQWNGLPFEQPFQRSRDVLRFVRAALSGEKVSGDFDTFTVAGFRLEQPPVERVEILLAALRPQMLALAGSEADGAILNWLSAEDVGRCVTAVANPRARIVARIFVCPTEDAGYARSLGRRLISAYLTVPAYAQFHRWLGRTEQLGELWRLWSAGERAAAAAAIPDEVIDALIVHGSAADCRTLLGQYVTAGVEVPVLAVLPTPEVRTVEDLARTLAELAPAAGRR